MSFISKIYDTLTSVAQVINICKKPIHYQLDTEIDTGDYWIDGKKIYLAVIKANANNNTNVQTINIPSNINIDYIVNFDFKANNNKSSYSYKNYNEDTSYFYCGLDKNVIQLRTNNSQIYNSNVYIFIYYTKL